MKSPFWGMALPHWSWNQPVHDHVFNRMLRRCTVFGTSKTLDQNQCPKGSFSCVQSNDWSYTHQQSAPFTHCVRDWGHFVPTIPWLKGPKPAGQIWFAMEFLDIPTKNHEKHCRLITCFLFGLPRHFMDSLLHRHSHRMTVPIRPKKTTALTICFWKEKNKLNTS